MPLPTPNKDESQDDFLSRCMGDGLMNEEYPDDDQRHAVCQGQWDKKDDSMNYKSRTRAAGAAHRGRGVARRAGQGR